LRRLAAWSIPPAHNLADLRGAAFR